MRDYKIVNDDAVGVHLLNPEEITIRTEEIEPEHTVCSFITVPTALPPGQQEIPPALQLDPARKETSIILSSTGTVVLCHSLAQAINVINGALDGCAVQAPATIRWTSTAPLWIVSTTGLKQTVTVGTISTRRGT